MQLPREARDKAVVLPPYLQHSRTFDLRTEYQRWQAHQPESLPTFLFTCKHQPRVVPPGYGRGSHGSVQRSRQPRSVSLPTTSITTADSTTVMAASPPVTSSTASSASTLGPGGYSNEVGVADKKFVSRYQSIVHSPSELCIGFIKGMASNSTALNLTDTDAVSHTTSRPWWPPAS